MNRLEVSLLLRELLRKEYQDGVVLDGFPRTNVQVECLKLLVDKILMATGRSPNSATIGLGSVGVALERGFARAARTRS